MGKSIQQTPILSKGLIMENHEIDLKLLDEIMNKKSRLYESQQRHRKKFKHQPIQIRSEHKFYPLLKDFRDLYYQRYEKRAISIKHFLEAAGEYMTVTCEEGCVYRPGEATIFKYHPSVEIPKNDDPILDLGEPVLSQNKGQDEVVYEVSATIKIKKIVGKN